MNTTHGFTHDQHGFIPVVKSLDELPSKAVLRIYELMQKPLNLVSQSILELLLSYSPKKVKLTDGDYVNLIPLIKPVLMSRLTKNPLPWLKIGGKKFIGPADVLGNVSFYEWILCNQYANAFAEGDREASLKLAAVLWRPQRPFLERVFQSKEDDRVALTDALIAQSQGTFKPLPGYWLASMMLFFVGSRDAICEANPLIFAKKKEGNAPDYDLTDLMADMAKEYGKSPKEVSGWSFDEVLFHLTKQHKANARNTGQ